MNDLGAMLDLAQESGDPDLEQELTTELGPIRTALADTRLELLLSGELDPNNAICRDPSRRGRDGIPGLGADAAPHVRPMGRRARNSRWKRWTCFREKKRE